MAEETEHTPERQKTSGGDQDNSPVNTAGKPNVQKKRDNAVPHYLRASAGSCHDACKYGKPHEFKNKPWKPMRRRVLAPSPDTEKAQEIQIFIDKKVEVVLQADEFEPSLAQDSPPVDVTKKIIPSSRISPELDSSRVIKQEVLAFRKSPLPDPKEMKKVIRSTWKLPFPDTLKPIKQEVSSKHASSNVKERNASASAGSSKSNSFARKPSSSEDSSIGSVSKRDVSSKRASSNVKERNAPVSPSKWNGSAVKPSSSADSSSVGSGGKGSGKISSVYNPRTSRVSVKKDMGMATPASLLSSKKTPKVEVTRILNSSVIGPTRKTVGSKAGSSNLKKNKTLGNQSHRRTQASPKNGMITKKVESMEPTEETVEEKTLHMIETREDNGNHSIQSPSPLSPESLNSSTQANSPSFASHEMDDEPDLGSDYTDNSEVDDLKEEKGQLDHAATVVSEDQDPSSKKLKFRRGKVVEPQQETNSPRRLRFRLGKNLGDNQGVNGGPPRKSFRKRANDSDKKEPERGQVKVVLKHQEIETKKDGQVLFNNVIEETASKLVQTRKSKVKALVGAFETVISLQESKPSAAATANR